MSGKYRLGWIPDVPDTRDVKFSRVFRLPRSLPGRIDLRAGCSPVKNQGTLGSCTAHALTGVLEFMQLQELAGVLPRYRDLSRLFVYYNTRELMGTVHSDSGAMLRTTIKSVKRTGVCREALWPYVTGHFAIRPPPPCYAEARKYRIVDYQRLDTLAEMKACLAMNHPFVFGFAVYEHVMNAATARTGKVRLPRRGERMLGGHAVMAVGYNDRSRRIFFRNSWGAAWGQDGYGELPYAYMEKRELSDDFWCVRATTGNLYAARGRP